MIIDNQNKVFQPISITFQDEWEARLFKTILEHAAMNIGASTYVYNEEGLTNLINELNGAIE